MTLIPVMIGTSSTFKWKPRFVTNNGDKNEVHSLSFILLVLSSSQKNVICLFRSEMYCTMYCFTFRSRYQKEILLVYLSHNLSHGLVQSKKKRDENGHWLRTLEKYTFNGLIQEEVILMSIILSMINLLHVVNQQEKYPSSLLKFIKYICICQELSPLAH